MLGQCQLGPCQLLSLLSGHTLLTLRSIWNHQVRAPTGGGRRLVLSFGFVAAKKV